MKVYTDGACSGNPGPGGYAYVIITCDKEIQNSSGKKLTTNNEMELLAVLKALEYLEENENNLGINLLSETIEIYSDSAYLVNTFNQKWINSWAKKGWKTSTGHIVANLEIMQRLYLFNNKYNLKFKKVPGHSGVKYNEICDRLAVIQRDKYSI